MASLPEVCTAVGASGLDSSGGFRLPDVDSLDTAASDLTTHAASFRSGIDTAAQTWSGLGASYFSDESPTVLAAFAEVSPLAAKVSSDAQLTSQALSAFSSTCRDLRQRLEAYGRSVRDLDGDIDAFPASVEKTTMVKGEQIKSQVQQHWTGDADLTARHDSLAAEVKAIHDEYLNAQDTCAAAMATVSGGETYRSERIVHADLSSGNWFTEALFNVGTFLGIENEEDQNPWGQDTVPYRPNGVVGELQGFGAGALMLVDGVWSLIPVVSNQTKHDRAVEGLKTLVTNPGSIDWGAVWSSAIHEDEAKTNPSWAGGANVFSVASLFIPGVGIGAKAGTVANKAGSVAGKIGTATADSSRLGKLSPILGGAAHGLNTTGAFLSKPGSFAVKVSDLLMPQTTAKVLDALTAMKVKVAPGAAVPDSAGSLPDGPPDTADAAPVQVADDAADAAPAHAADDVTAAADARADQIATDNTPVAPDLTDESVLAQATTKVEVLGTTGIAHYAPDGSTKHTGDLVHPRADLEKRIYPVQDAKPGLAADSPLVQRQLPKDFTMWGGKPREHYAGLYAEGTYPNGAPKVRSEVWPDKEQHPQGFLSPEARTPVVLQPGHLIDRYGLPRGNFTSPVGENFPDRALPDFSLEKFGRRDGYHQYEVLHEIPAWAGPAAPAFGKDGGATQYYTNLKINELLDKGFIREVTP